MIQRAFITAWRSTVPWVTDAQVEQDLIASRAIVEIFSEPELASALAFRGGTALHKLVFNPPGRYSEDIDLVQVRPEPIGPILDALHRRLDPWLGIPRWKHGAGPVSLTYRMQSETPPVTPLRLKVEINTREHFTVHGYVRRPFTVENPWFSGTTEVVTYSTEELLATKLRALYQRRKGRDLFDLALALDRLTVDPVGVVEAFARYMEHGGHAATRAQFEANLAAKRVDPIFTADITPLLSTAATPYDAARALERVQQVLVARLPGDPWKGAASVEKARRR